MRITTRIKQIALAFESNAFARSNRDRSSKRLSGCGTLLASLSAVKTGVSTCVGVVEATSDSLGTATGLLHPGHLMLRPGDQLLLCSDGLTNMLGDNQILALLQSAASPETACRGLIDAANDAGGKDNVTVVVVDVGDKTLPRNAVRNPPRW